MFARGGRFPQHKPSEVPGPNAYDVQDPEYDVYKHGAFLEKANRFSKQKSPEVAGPSICHPDTQSPTKHAKRPVKNSMDRTASLQKKVEELERQLQECKKAHYVDNERFKFDLHRAQKSHLEQNERIDKLKKQNEALESRVQELKKICDKEKSDNKELRSKLRVSEYERTQLSSKEGEVGELKKALHALDAKRRDELRDRDRRVAEVEKILSGEKKKRDALASRLAEANGKREGEVHAARDVAQTLEAALRDAKAEAERVKKSLAGLQARSASIEEALLGQLEQHRDMLSRVADEYGRLASSTVSRHEHSQVKFELAANQLRVLRLERKLANAEAQVIEVANLVRHTKDENKFFARILFETEREAALYATEVKELSSMVSSLLQVDRDLDDVHRDLDDVHRAVGEDIQASEQTTHRIETGLASKFAEFHKLRSRQLLLHSSAALKQLDEKDSKISAAESQLAKLLDELTRIREKETSTQHQLHEATTSLAEAQGQIFVLKSQLEETKATTKAEVEKMERVVTQEKEAVQRLVSTVTQSRRAEEALQEEVEQLTSELTEAERYVEAYTNIVDEVGVLVQRNALAEEEAERLSKFNAEILGHRNPAQRIMYVDRIRRELHEMKQKLIVATREKEGVLDENEELRYELAMYKSIAVPADSRPRANMTRVTRMPLSSQNQNIMSMHLAPGGPAKKFASSVEMEHHEGDMTLDEIS